MPRCPDGVILTVEVARLHQIKIREHKSAHPGAGEHLSDVGAEPAESRNSDCGPFDFLMHPGRVPGEEHLLELSARGHAAAPNKGDGVPFAQRQILVGLKALIDGDIGVGSHLPLELPPGLCPA